MADKKSDNLEREYVIPLRRHWLRVPQYERTGKAIKAIKKFIAKHMKVSERDVDKVKLDMYMNNEIWFRGRRHPPAKVKVRAVKEGDIVKVQLVELPEHVKFLKAKHEKIHKLPEKKEEKKVEEKPEEKSEEAKKNESEKEKSVAQLKEAEIKQDAKAEKHTPKIDKHKTQPRRMALQK